MQKHSDENLLECLGRGEGLSRAQNKGPGGPVVGGRWTRVSTAWGQFVGTVRRLLRNLVSFLLSAWGLRMFLRKGMIRLVLEIYCGLQMVAGSDGVVEGACGSLAVS